MLVDVSFYIEEQGDIISILGPSGVGKTTILEQLQDWKKFMKEKYG